MSSKIMSLKNFCSVFSIIRRDFSFLYKNVGTFQKVNLFAPKYEAVAVTGYKSLLYFSDSSSKCWQCNYPHIKNELFCSKCKVLQHLPESITYFDVIGVKKEYNVATDIIKKKYLLLQTLLHPDRFGKKSDEEKNLSEKLSSLVNKAYSTLSDPLERGLYLLQLHNISIPEGTTSLDPSFLMEIMEKNEEIEEALKDQEKIMTFLKQNRNTMQLLIKNTTIAFSNNDLEEAKKLLTKMKYYSSIDKRLKKRKQELGITE